MDSPSKDMYDTFKDEIWKELGPLDPNWFDILTAQTSANEEDVSDQDELCANQEGNFKTPLEKPAVDSQLFSTPKVFRHSRILSPETEDEHSFTTEQEKGALPWSTTQSPCLFQMSKQGIPDAKYGGIQPQSQGSFDLLHTPHKSPASYAKHISESLGAQINPDISWTSSFNTPPAVPSTLILSKTDESPCPVNVSVDNTVVFVRKLFPSLSNASKVGVAPLKNNDMPATDQGAVSPDDSFQTSLNQNEVVWQQKLPDAIEDGEICTTVASVPDGAENVSSIFFANSSSALRKVRPNKTKRKQIIAAKEHGCSFTDNLTTNNAASSEERAADREPGSVFSSPPEKSGVTGITQWSPLSLSEISPSAVDINILTGQLKSGCDSCQPVMPPMKITDSGPNKKKRKFVYTVGTVKTQSQGNEAQIQKMISSPGIPDSGQELSVKQLRKASGGADCCSTGQKLGNLAGGNLPPSVQANVQDLDMSQLHRDFAQDFSQIPDSGMLSKVVEHTRSHFSPSACLSAMKQAKQKAKQASSHSDCDEVRSRRLVSASYQNYSTNEGTVIDSGFQSAVTDLTHTSTSSFAVPFSENTDQSQQCPGFKTDIHRTTPLTSTNKGNGKVHLGAEAKAELSSAQKERWILDPGTETGLHMERIATQLLSSANGAVNSTNCIPLNGQIHGSLPEETAFSLPSVSASGFKTASNKSIRISSANLEKAKHLFEESQNERTFSDRLTKSIHTTEQKISTSNGPVKNATSTSNLNSLSETSGNVSCQLTASQKADVTELCTLLEETDSQFEFTQAKISQVQQHGQDDVRSPQKADKELDPDFLTGIDFDDSFSSDAEKHLATVIPDKMTSVSNDKANSGTSSITRKSTDVSFSSAVVKENSSTGDISFSSEHISEGSSCVMSTKPNHLQRTEHTETSKMENKNPLMLGVAFKTAGENVLRVSKTCLSKARALFADLQENLPDQKSPDMQNSENDDKTKQQCSVDSNTGEDDSKLTLKDDCHVGERIQGCHSSMESAVCSDKRVTSIADNDATRSFRNGKVDTTMCQSGFHMASGKGIAISAKYMRQAEAFFKDCDANDQNDSILVKYKKSIEPVSERADNKKNLSKYKSPRQVRISDEHASGRTNCENVNAGLRAPHTKEPHPDHMKMKSIGFNGRLPLKNTMSFHGNPFSTSKPFSHPLCTTSKNTDSAAIDELSSCDGFCTASEKKVSVSADALKKPESLLKEICTLEDTNNPLDQKENCESTGQLTSQTQVSPPKNGGFQTASGNRVVISSAALKKAKSLFSECDEVDDKLCVRPSHSKPPVHGPPPRNDEFLTASGKRVALSSEVLQKAKSLFSDISAEIQDGLHTRDSDKKQEKIHCSFTAARGEKAHLSQKNPVKEFDSTSTKANQETDAFFKDFDMDGNSGMSVTCKSVSSSASDKKTLSNIKADQTLPVRFSEQRGHGYTEHTNKLGKQKEDAVLPQNTGFQTASGKGVSISSAALKKAKSLFSECDEVDELSLKPSHFKCPVQGPPPRKDGFLTASGKQVALSSEALLKAKSLFSDISYSADVSHIKSSDKKQDNHEQCGFTTAGGQKVHMSQRNLLKAKHLLSEFDSVSAKAMQEADDLFKDCQMDCNNATSIKCRSIAPLSRSDNQKKPHERLTVNVSERAESGCTEHTSKQEEPKEETLPPLNGGFRTASGKGVAISSEALRKAEALLSECEKIDHKIGSMPPHSMTPLPAPSFRNRGFLAASGKLVALSSEALQKAKALFGDISLSADITAISDKRKSDEKFKDAQNNTDKKHSGFTTAGGAKVHVSEKSLLKANNLLKEFADGECHDSRYSGASPCDTHKLDLLKMKDVNQTTNSDLTAAIDKYMPTKESASFAVKSAPADAFQFQEDKIIPLGTENLHDITEQEMSCVLDCEINERSSKGPKVIRTDEFSVLSFQSLNLTGCTETQQKFLAQEALDCTKALLEDEGLAGQSLPMTLENMPLEDNPQSSNTSAEDEKTRGKRSMEDADMTSQPPLKRRLLEEFDRTVDGPRGSTLQPVKNCPNGVMRDRRVFKYSASLHPNITGPPRTGKNLIETRLKRTTHQSTPGDSRSAYSKMPAFVPPFIKNTTTETHKNAAVKDEIRAPTVFVPPFKKQRTVQESSSKPQEEEEKHPHHFAVPSNSCTYVPPSKKTHGARDVTALMDTTSDNMMNSQSLSGGCGSISYGAEVSHVDDTFSRSQEIYQNLQSTELARDMQDMRIRKKKRQTIRPLPGSLFLTKTSGVMRIPLKVAMDEKPPARYTQKQLYEYGVHKHVSDITGETAESFRFNLLQFLKKEAFADEGGIQLADGGWLIPSKDGTAGKEEFYRSLCDTPGVDPKLISEAWVYNHYRWIVWKQASMEKSFPEAVGGLCLTPEQVLLQLKYRYDVEVDHSRRPALRKIMEKDDTSAKTLILCVCEIVSRGHSPIRQIRSDTKNPQSANAKVEAPSAVVWLTDGWYAIKAQLDEPLTAMLHKGRLAVGGKLIIHGAQLVGSQDACSPLEAPESLMLKICANSSRPARWDAKLGFHRDPRPFLLPVSSLYSNGGPVGCVDIIILRSYPIQWMERKTDGGAVFRSVRAEEKEARRYNNHKQKAMETLFTKIQSEFEKEEKRNNKPQRRRQRRSRQNFASLQDGEELYEAVGDDPAYLEAHLSIQQMETLHTYRRSLVEKKQAELQDRYRRALEGEDNEGSCPKRDVTPVWRLCITDSMGQPGSVYQLSLWRPTSDLQSLLKEGHRYKVYNLTTSDGKKHSSVESVQLTGTKKTQFEELQASQEWLSARFQPRVSTNFVTLQNPEFQPLCGEVDLTGCVISVIDVQGPSPAFYLADGNLNFVKVRCFSSLSQSGLEDVVKPNVLLALSNLQLRGQSMHPTPVVYAGDLTVFSTNPKEAHLQESLSQLRNVVQHHENFFLSAEEKLSHLIRSDGLSSITSPALQPQTPASATDKRQETKTSGTLQKPNRSLGSFTPVSRNPPAATSSSEKDPRSLKRRRALDYLSRIPSPPPLSHLGSVGSPCVNKTFNPPRRSATPSTLKTVQTPAHKPTDSLVEDEWVHDEELAMIDTQALHGGDLL
ncbi:breast cancer type 2 susceptibility protein [Amphiprion ocellaris]|uniref:breast cancer type 2 susceptibility protein n=1 Tax=Amphiprion ocellaris TaxID=80972 RepID=UPI000C315158|nr:breast cancer type 2 susceptibility protein [Amphiprion ocellaris]